MNYEQERIKKEFIQICGKIELRNKIYYTGGLYELPPFYYRRVPLSTKIRNRTLFEVIR